MRTAAFLRDDERGGAMVEFALVAPFVFLLLVGIIEMGRAWNTYQVITDAAREGARQAVVADTTTKVVGDDGEMGSVPRVILDRLGRAGMKVNGAWTDANHADDCTGWNAPSGTITGPEISGCGWGGTSGAEARVVIRTPYPFDFLRTLLGLFDGSINEMVLQSDFVMRNE